MRVRVRVRVRVGGRGRVSTRRPEPVGAAEQHPCVARGIAAADVPVAAALERSEDGTQHGHRLVRLGCIVRWMAQCMARHVARYTVHGVELHSTPHGAWHRRRGAAWRSAARRGAARRGAVR